jgi:shikimate dehydrogenase
MGEYGAPCRILYRLFNSLWTYCYTEPFNKTGEGQLSEREMFDIYDSPNINASTKIYGLIGNPVSHSFGTSLFNIVFKKCGFKGVYIPVLSKSCNDGLKLFRDLGMNGASVTHPFKENMMPFMNKNSKEVLKIKAVNTIKIESGGLYGYNTDWMGIRGCLKKLLNNRVCKKEKITTAIVGAGGAARALLYTLQNLGNFNVYVANRTMHKAKLLTKEFGVNYIDINSIQNLKPDILINATPVGMGKLVEETPVKEYEFDSKTIVIDLIYNPTETLFLRQAKEAGCPTMNGLEIFLKQAEEQFSIWTGRKLDFCAQKTKLLS